MNRIVIVNQWASHLTKDIANALNTKYKIVLIAGQISESGNALKTDIEVIKIKNYNKKNKLTRATTWLMGFIQIIILIKTKFREDTLFLSSNPPLTVFIPLFCKNKYYFQILDIYPDALLSSGIIKESSLIYRFWSARTLTFLQKAIRVFTITDGMGDTISKYCPAEKIKVIPQWPAFNKDEVIEKGQNIFIKAHSLEDKFLVIYAGNIGMGHKISALIEAANVLKNHKDIFFIIIGEGWNKRLIEELIRNYKLENCITLPFQSAETFKYVLQATDLGVVSVSKEMANLMVPIKTYNLINNHIPILGITEGESEIMNLISKHNIGKCFSPDQFQEIADFILRLKNDKDLKTKLQQNLESVSGLFTSENAMIYLEEFNKSLEV